MTHFLDAPHPDLRIVPTPALHPHEEHDSQRSTPLAERLRTEAFMINPPLVAPMDDDYVILDGANRYHAFTELGYPHILVQVVDYTTDWVQLDTWHHVIGGWQGTHLLREAAELSTARIHDQPDDQAAARFTLVTGEVYSVIPANGHTVNAAVRAFVALYQRSAALHRTAIHDTEALWDLYPDAIALVRFLQMQPADIVQAARSRDYLPPGISRHIVHGRAIRINYPLQVLRDRAQSLEAKNAALQDWVRQKLATRQIRYYAEATYQFDE